MRGTLFHTLVALGFTPLNGPFTFQAVMGFLANKTCPFDSNIYSLLADRLFLLV